MAEHLRIASHLHTTNLKPPKSHSIPRPTHHFSILACVSLGLGILSQRLGASLLAPGPCFDDLASHSRTGAILIWSVVRQYLRRGHASMVLLCPVIKSICPMEAQLQSISACLRACASQMDCTIAPAESQAYDTFPTKPVSGIRGGDMRVFFATYRACDLANLASDVDLEGVVSIAAKGALALRFQRKGARGHCLQFQSSSLCNCWRHWQTCCLDDTAKA